MAETTTFSRQETTTVTKPVEQSAFEGKTMDAEHMAIDPSVFRWKVFIAGPSGSGKTQVLATLPGRKLIIDTDRRAETLIGMPNVEIYPCYEVDARSPKAWDKLETVRRTITSEIVKGIFPFDTVAFDGLTMMGRQGMNWALTLDPKRGLGGAPAEHHYMPQMDALAKFILATLAWPVHVAYTGHIELIEDKVSGAHRFYPKITGKLRSELSNWFNETYYTYREFDSEAKRMRYFWKTAGSGSQEFFKSSLNQLGRYWVDPIEIDFDKKPVGFEDLWQRRFGPAKGGV